MQKYLVEKLDKIEERLDSTCQSITELKSVQSSFIEAYEKDVEQAIHEKERRFDIKLSLLAVGIAVYQIYAEMFGK